MKNESAFPLTNDVIDQCSSGLTKREYFAAKVLQANLSYPIPEYLAEKYTGKEWMEIMARSAVVQADALIAELEKEVK